MLRRGPRRNRGSRLRRLPELPPVPALPPVPVLQPVPGAPPEPATPPSTPASPPSTPASPAVLPQVPAKTGWYPSSPRRFVPGLSRTRSRRWSRVMLASARMLPANTVPVPRVAELPTCQNARQSWPPLMRTTDASLAVVSVLPIWKTKTALGSPSASRTSVPVNWADDEKQ